MARLSLLAACVFVVSGSSASASSSGVLRLHLHRLPYTVDSYPMASGDYALLSLSQAVGHYVVFDDKTHHRTVLSPPDNCSMWGSATFAVPWIVFSCPEGPAFRLYNVASHRWRLFGCGAACANIGVAAPEAFGSRWMEVNEDAYCDPRIGPCSTPSTAFVSLPSARTGVYRPARRRVLDLNSPSLSRTVCDPLAAPAAAGSLTFFGRFAVTSGSQPEYLERCGSHLHRRLLGTPIFDTGTVHAIIMCTPPPSSSLAPAPSHYSAVFLPSLKHDTFTVPTGFERCGAALDDNALYVSDSDASHVWRASFPTAPPRVGKHGATK